MKKVLILTCSTGEGHNSAAYAIKTAFENKGILCELIDPVIFKGEKAKELVSACYNNLIKKNPSVFGAIYKLGDWYSATSLPSPVYWANASYADRLERYIMDNHFDAVVCTHLYGMEAMTAILKRKPSLIPCYGVLTDYTCIPFTGDTRLNGYFIPHKDMKQYLIDNCVREEYIHVTGIPVDSRFEKGINKDYARELLNIDQEAKIYLLMTGGVGCENMVGICDELLSALRKNDQILVMTGRNDKLKDRLDKKYNADSRMRTVAFTKKVELYMAAADVILTKPGGLSSTEAAVVNIPLVHVNAIPGCETCNAHFFSEHGMSLWAKNNYEAVRFAQLLTEDTTRSEKMRAAQRKHIYPDAAQTIVQEICGK